MHLLTLLLIIYLLFFLALLIFLDQQSRNYWKRGLMPLYPCPFGSKEYEFTEMATLGTRSDRDGLLSYSLYGNFGKYLPILERSLDSSRDLLPSWQSRVYVASNADASIITSLLSRGAEVIVMGPHPPKGHEAALWRFLPLEEELPFVCLDADDVFSGTTVKQIQAWIKSNQTFCNLSPVIFFVPFTANAWGSRGRAIPDIRDRIGQYCEHWYGFDEAFLKKEVWPVAETSGCWFTTCLRLDKGVIGFMIILLALIMYSLWMAWSY